MSGKRITLVASCKWRNELTKLGDPHDLRRTAARAGAGDDVRYVLFSRAGFDPELGRQAEVENVWLVNVEQMYDER